MGVITVTFGYPGSLVVLSQRDLHRFFSVINEQGPFRMDRNDYGLLGIRVENDSNLDPKTNPKHKEPLVGNISLRAKVTAQKKLVQPGESDLTKELQTVSLILYEKKVSSTHYPVSFP